MEILMKTRLLILLLILAVPYTYAQDTSSDLVLSLEEAQEYASVLQQEGEVDEATPTEPEVV